MPSLVALCLPLALALVLTSALRPANLRLSAVSTPPSASFARLRPLSAVASAARVLSPPLTGQDEEEDEDADEAPSDARATLATPLRRTYLTESPVRLAPLTPIEAIINGSLFFGNFLREKPGSKAVVLRLESGVEVAVDAAQVISAWDSLDADDNCAFSSPTTADEWAQTASRAVDLLARLSPRKAELEDFWRQVSQQGTLGQIFVDSFDLAIYTFQERKFRLWINPQVMDVSQARIYVPTAGQRYAMALLLFQDRFRFKRRASQYLYPEELVNNTYYDECFLREGNTFLREGGYQALKEMVVVHRETDAFLQHFRSGVNRTHGDEEKDLPTCITRLLRALEIYALQSQRTPPPPAVKQVLRALQRELTPQGARSVLVDLNLNSKRESKVRTGDLAASMGGFGITLWPQPVLQAANDLQRRVARQKQDLEKTPVSGFLKRGPTGRRDLRALQAEHPVFCLDAKETVFFDDAFSLSPATGEILVHIVDVWSLLRHFPALADVARERVSSVFLPSGPLHMLPPLAMENLCLSTQTCNEVITAAFCVDEKTGDVVNTRIFPALIGPVAALDIRAADDMLVGASLDPLARELQWLFALVQRLCAANPWLDASLTHRTRYQGSFDRRSGLKMRRESDVDGAHRIINSLLSLYSNATYRFCQDEGLPVPLAWEQRDVVDSSLPRRFATQPLRHYISLLQQQQVRAALRMQLPLSRDACALAVAQHNQKRRENNVNFRAGDLKLKYEILQQAATQEDKIFVAEALGKGTLVNILPLNVKGVAIDPRRAAGAARFAEGQRLKVKVKKVVMDSRSVTVEVVDSP